MVGENRVHRENQPSASDMKFSHTKMCVNHSDL